MPLDPRKKQKKLERRKAKDKARLKTQLARRSHFVAHRFDRAARGKVLDCLVPTELWIDGIGQVLLSRDLGEGRVAFAVFLLDVFCLGVKDAAFAVVSREKYESQWLPRLVERFPCERKQPEYLRKLVEDGVAYARSFGLEPHPDYLKAKSIFGDIDPALCRETFQFGHGGKPFFVSGPYDSPARCRKILEALGAHGGADNNYSLQVRSSQLHSLNLLLPVEPEQELDETDSSLDEDSPGPHF